MKRAWPLALALAGCAASRPAPRSRAPLDPSVCPSSIDAAALLRRSARAFGTEQAVRRSLPRVFRYTFETEGKRGSAQLVLDEHGHRWDSLVAGLRLASGIDEHGPWDLGVTGVMLRQSPQETPDTAFDGWVLRRGYLGAFDPKRDAVGCKLEPGRPARVAIRYALPEYGAPQLELDPQSGAVVLLTTVAASGRDTWMRYDAWTAPDENGVRWPSSIHRLDDLGNEEVLRLDVSAPSACRGDDCLTPPPSRLVLEWPATGVVRVPMRHYLGELSLEVTLGGRKAWALLDSGAGTTVVDADMPAAKGFVSNLELEGAGATQPLKLGLGELSSLAVGDLRLRHAPAASIPIPALDAFGDRRPEIVLGFGLFEAAVVRVDYARSELVLGSTAEGLVSPAATPLPIVVVDGKPLAGMKLNDALAPVILDTGNNAGIDLYKRWATAHGLPGARKTALFHARTGAGTQATDSTFFRLEHATLGPIHHDHRLTSIDDPPDPGIIAGFVGNDVLGHCAAVVFDVPHRKLWLEPPCDRPQPDPLHEWRLMRSPSRQLPDRPWVVETVVVGGSAADAGIRPGDRIVSVDGVPADLDVSKIQERFMQRPGTRVSVQLVRDGATLTIPVTLHYLVDDGAVPTP